MKDACLRFCKVEREVDSYDHLEDIFTDLKTQLSGFPNRQVLDSRFIPLRERKLEGDYGQFRPHFFSTVKDIQWRRQSWVAGLAYGEVKRTSKMHQEPHPTKYKFNLGTLVEVRMMIINGSERVLNVIIV